MGREQSSGISPCPGAADCLGMTIMSVIFPGAEGWSRQRFAAAPQTSVIYYKANFLAHSGNIPVVVVMGGSSGLGLAIVRRFLDAGYFVIATGRDPSKFPAAVTPVIDGVDGLARLSWRMCDATNAESLAEFYAIVKTDYGRLNVLINCVGRSDRGTVESLDCDRLVASLEANVVTALQSSQAAFPLLCQSRGVVVNIGSLAGKVGTRYLGAYCASKHALAGLTQQMRLEWKDVGVHVALVSPGPIRRADAGERYRDLKQLDGVPETAMRPGGGTSIKGLEPEKVADAVYLAVLRRSPDVILPRWLRLVFTLGQALPRLGDWLLSKETRS